MDARTIESLCLALDEGDDQVLPFLADALEEVGNHLAPWFRTAAVLAVPRYRRCDNFRRDEWEWLRSRPYFRSQPGDCRVTPRIFRLLPRPPYDNWVAQVGSDRVLPYPSRSAAYFALATAYSRLSLP